MIVISKLKQQKNRYSEKKSKTKEWNEKIRNKKGMRKKRL